MFLRCTRRFRSEVTDFYRKLFRLHALGRVAFQDGDELITFTKEPRVIEAFGWDEKELPAILIGVAGAEFEFEDLRNYMGDVPLQDGSGVTPVEGGAINLDLTVTCVADTDKEAENMLDFASLYSLNSVGRAYFARRGLIFLPHPPKLSGVAAMVEDINDPALNRYEGSFTLSGRTYWNMDGANLSYPTGFLQGMELVTALEEA